jgi:hypothetical protein
MKKKKVNNKKKLNKEKLAKIFHSALVRALRPV